MRGMASRVPVLLVPGGMRAADAIRDDETLNFSAEETRGTCAFQTRVVGRSGLNTMVSRYGHQEITKC